MEQLKNEQTEVNSQPAEAEERLGEEKTEVSLGKFNDVQSLLSAYNSLEAEFTKRCQKIKELESAISKDDKAKAPSVERVEEEDKPTEKSVTEEEILKGYIRSVLCKKQTALVMDGSGASVKAPTERPKNLREASMLAQELFNK